MRKKFIQKRWVAAGIYHFSRVTSTWEFNCEYHKKSYIWKFDHRSLTRTLSDGTIVDSTPYEIRESDILMIDHWLSINYFDTSYEFYRLEVLGQSLFLCDMSADSKDIPLRAIRLVPLKETPIPRG